MASVPETPALPWAASDAAQQSSIACEKHAAVDKADDDVHGVSLDQLGLNIGDRIEVMWHVQQDEGEELQRWWGARITAAEPSASSSSNTPAYTITYDAWPEGDFPEEEITQVALMPEHRLVDLQQQAEMAWRREGEDYTPPAADGDSDSEGDDDEAGSQDMEQEGPEGGIVSVQQLASSITDADVAADDADMLDRLGAMEPAQQVQMAAAYRDFMDNFKQFVDAKASSSTDGDVLITTDDVQAFKAMMMTQAAQRGRLHRAM